MRIVVMGAAATILAALKFVLIRLSPPARHDADAFYVGLGNQFDDDRRLVRVSVSTSQCRGERRVRDEGEPIGRSWRPGAARGLPPLNRSR